jgi:lipopolysaccharide transport system permease protein/teichoic acid transport system permease protein
VGDLFSARRTIQALAGRQIQMRYSGTLFRGAWEILHPVVTILLYWFVFSIAFKARGPEGIPFIAYFITGMLPWMCFAEGIQSGGQGVVSHGFLIKKMVFKSELLPFVFLVAGGLNHGLLMILASGILIANGVPITWCWLQVAYYFITMCSLMLGLQWLLSSLTVFHRDLGQAVTMGLNVVFWSTPVVWVAKSVLSPEYQWVLFLNPLCYIVEGYRASLLYNEPIWLNWQQALYVWALLVLLAATGFTVFRRLKPHFGDVL